MCRLHLAALASLLTVSSSPVFAAPPDAGDILRQQPQLPSAVPATKPQVVPAEPAAEEKDTGPKVLVKSFHIQGALLIPQSELVAYLNPFVGKELSFAQLRSVAARLSDYYFQKGYLARVVLPEQDIKDGIVTLQVIEGKRGDLRINTNGERIDAARVGRFVDRRLAPGGPMNIANLGEALNILNEQPGLAAASSMAPGKAEGDIDVTVNVIGKPLFSAFFGADNRGLRSTGVAQAIGGLSLSNPTGNLDLFSVMASASEGTTYGRMDYSIAVGDAGLRVGAIASRLSYHVTQSGFDALQPKGTADTFGATFSYPLMRLPQAEDRSVAHKFGRAELGLNLTGSYQEKRLVDQTVAGETGNRHVSVSNIGLSGYMAEMPGQSANTAILSAGLSFSFGDSDQRNAAALSTDSSTRQIQGSFSKVSYNAGFLQPLSSTWSFNASLRGQTASKNLDSTERFSLGGPYGVRAYPVGEATGDEGWLLSLTLSDKLSGNLAANFFIDTGSVRLNRNTWDNWNASNTNLPNTYELSGWGVGLDYRVSPQILLNASIATPIGKNPGRDVNGLNSDGYGNHTRAWVGLAGQF